MRRMIVVVASLGLAAACKQKPAEEMAASPGHSGAMGKQGAAGSAMGTTMPDGGAPGIAVDAAPPPPKTPDELAKRYDECLRFSNAASWEELRGCYAPDATFEAPGLQKPRDFDAELAETRSTRADFADYEQIPQLVVIDQTTDGTTTIVAILLVRATHAATKRPVGILLGHVVVAAPDGRFTRDLAFFDAATVQAQIARDPAPAIASGLVRRESIIGKSGPDEQASRAALAKLTEAIAAHDAGALAAVLADDVAWSEPGDARPLGKRAVIKRLADRQLAVEHTWVAGSYVAVQATQTGAAASALPVLHVYRFADGKLAQAWVFYQQRAKP